MHFFVITWSYSWTSSMYSFILFVYFSVGAWQQRVRESGSERRPFDQSHRCNRKMANMDMLRGIPREVPSGLASNEHNISSPTHEFYLREFGSWIREYMSCGVRQLHRIWLRSKCVSWDHSVPMESGLRQGVAEESDADDFHVGHTCRQHGFRSSVWQVGLYFFIFY